MKEIHFDSTNGENKVYAKIIEPQIEKIKGIVQICHGMCEYFDKYEEFTSFLLKQGYVVCGHDHIGHGESINSEMEKGFFAEKDGYKYLIRDTKKFTEIVKNQYNDKQLPYFLFGHSMGSFIVRCYAAKYANELSGIILCGTIGPQILIRPGIRLARTMAKAKGNHYRSKKLYNLALDFANIKFLPISTRFDWISSDEQVVQKHIKDKKSNFIFTVSGFEDLFHLVGLCNSPKVIKTTPKELPIFFISGEADPIGENGIGVKRAVKIYKNLGMEKVELKIYPNDRHELVNEKNKEEVYQDVLKFMENVRSEL